MGAPLLCTLFAQAGKGQQRWGGGHAVRRRFRAPLRHRRGPRLCINGGAIKGKGRRVLRPLSCSTERGAGGEWWCVPFGCHPFPICAEAGWREPGRRGREQGAPAQYTWRTGGRQPGVRKGGGTSKRGGSMQTQFACSLPSLHPLFACHVARKGGGRRQLVEEEGERAREGKGRVLIAPTRSVDALFTLIFCCFLLSY